ncbi:carboxylesterase [Laetiporus sulphureus 93-53]|uniref:Carboxylic ester hydrolase n=1 Tax=Laetiporus sulphureus 93-53 TaxID=1314785 RepID=A0A165EGR5_9APHY|nr:carboxylesterase [Laetiporus sulphureus 93-53]KZT07020.1 carboxylesterase [Laetiporus sulphureus 93-53]
MYLHLQDELARSAVRIVVHTPYGPITGGRALNDAAVFLEVPYALPPGRFMDPEPLPPYYRYEDKEYIYESSYCAQPKNDGQVAGIPYEHKVGLGKPTENPLFVNIVSPPHFTPASRFPVKVYIHGGFLQFGSPHGLSAQAQHVSAERSEVWVNIGYRLSAFGFLACDEPKVDGNFGFKDQWLAALWIRDNIEAFGGDPKNIQISGLSAGCAHSVHQILHHVSRLPEGEQSPFQSAILQSNAIMTTPKTPAELRPQFQALCRALKLDPTSPDVLSILRNPAKVPTSAITHVIETDAVGVEYGTFRGCTDGAWLASTPDPMSWQRSGGFAHALKAKGVRSIVVGDLTEEWYLYAIAHPVCGVRDVEPNVMRYFPPNVVRKLLTLYTPPKEDASVEEVKKYMGDVLSDGQVHLPVRLLARDLMAADFPVVRYEIRWTPEQVRPFGYVTHGTDRSLWALLLSVLDPTQADVARGWLDTIAAEVKSVEAHGNRRNLKEVLALNADKTIGWKQDDRWDELMRLRQALPHET